MHCLQQTAGAAAKLRGQTRLKQVPQMGTPFSRPAKDRNEPQVTQAILEVNVKFSEMYEDRQ